MRTLPILFKTEMVQALLAGRKSCTRRAIKFPDGMTGRPVGKAGDSSNPLGVMYPGGIKRPPYQPGDILYVRETWERFECCNCEGDERGNCPKEPKKSVLDKTCGCYMYRATDEISGDAKWHPSIHMPKDAARIWLKVTDVRVERLQEITEDQTEEEGFLFTPPCLHLTGENYCDIDGPCTSKIKYCDMGAGELFGKVLWNSTIKKTDIDRYGWDANPYVWVIEFERCEKPGKE
jgi:hypothetical protein